MVSEGTTIQIGKVAMKDSPVVEVLKPSLSHLDGTGLMIYSNGLTFI